MSPDCKEAFTLFKKIIKPSMAAIQAARKSMEERRYVEAEKQYSEAIAMFEEDALSLVGFFS